MVCFRYVIANTLHKGDNKDKGDDNDVCLMMTYDSSNAQEKVIYANNTAIFTEWYIQYQ
jgi:hypothetical protein